jgi:Caspase domain
LRGVEALAGAVRWPPRRVVGAARSCTAKAPPAGRISADAPVNGFILRLLLAVALVWLACTPATAAKRVALVIGNDRYEALTPLHKAVSDARAVAATLKSIGFEVVGGENLGRRAMNQLLSEFDARLQPGDTAFVFFAGHCQARADRGARAGRHDQACAAALLL